MELAHFLRLLRSHWLGVVVITVAGGAAALGWALLQTPVYTADATGTVVAADAADDPNAAMLYNNLAKSEVKSYLEWAKTRAVADHAIDELGLEISPEELVKRIDVSNPEDTPVIRISADGPSPEKARDLATAWLNGLAEEGLAQSGGDKSHAVLKLRVTESAALPLSPSYPNKKIAIGLGLIAGCALGVAVAYVRGVLDRRIRNAEQVEREFSVSVVGSIPFDRDFEDDKRLGALDERGSNKYSIVREAMRELRTNLQFVNVDKPPRVIVVSSPLPGDGKSTTTANLALTIASSGKRVVIVDGDLRRPTVAKTFGLVDGVGLTDVLAGQAELVDVLQPWGDAGTVFALGAGKLPPNPSELLGSQAMRSVLDELSSHATVLIDAPPLIPVTDAVVLSNVSDGTLVVVSAGKTNEDALAKALQNLRKVHARVLGVVINRMPVRGPNSTAYGYGYYSADVPEGRLAKNKKRKVLSR